MKTVYIPSSAWLSEHLRCKAIIEKFMNVAHGKSDSLIVDVASVQREIVNESGEISLDYIEIDFSDWVANTLMEGSVINAESIRRAVSVIDKNHVYLINAVGFDAKIIGAAFEQLRIAFYSLPNWPKGMVLVGDNAQMYEISNILINCFYIRPALIRKTKVRNLIGTVMNDARMIRIISWSPRVKLMNIFRKIMVRSKKK